MKKLESSFAQFKVDNIEGYLSKIHDKLNRPGEAFTADELAGLDVLTSQAKSLETDIKSHHAADKAKQNSNKK